MRQNIKILKHSRKEQKLVPFVSKRFFVSLFVEVWLIYKPVWVSGVQQNDSIIFIHIFFRFSINRCLTAFKLVIKILPEAKLHNSHSPTNRLPGHWRISSRRCLQETQYRRIQSLSPRTPGQWGLGPKCMVLGGSHEAHAASEHLKCEQLRD